MDDCLRQLLDRGVEVQHEVSARRLSTFGAGGMVANLVLPKDETQLSDAMRILQSTRYHVLGGGSNTLISDFGLQWVVCLRAFVGATVDGNVLTACCGEPLPALSKLAFEHGLGGLEFASGIPALAGGALRMNAGAYGQDMAAIVDGAYLVDHTGGQWVSKEALHLRYRASTFSGVAAKVRFVLTPSDPVAIQAKMEDMRLQRGRHQPHQPSLGCVFKASGATPAAKYIEACGLKGTRLGQAQVSGVHCNFIVNMGGATARDYLRLADKVRSAVYERYGVLLEQEFVHLHD